MLDVAPDELFFVSNHDIMCVQKFFVTPTTFFLFNFETQYKIPGKVYTALSGWCKNNYSF